MTAFINNVNGMACVWVHVVISMLEKKYAQYLCQYEDNV